MDPDFFEVVMGADGTLKFVPVTEQAHAEVTISSEKRARETSRNRADLSWRSRRSERHVFRRRRLDRPSQRVGCSCTRGWCLRLRGSRPTHLDRMGTALALALADLSAATAPLGHPMRGALTCWCSQRAWRRSCLPRRSLPRPLTTRPRCWRPWQWRSEHHRGLHPCEPWVGLSAAGHSVGPSVHSYRTLLYNWS